MAAKVIIVDGEIGAGKTTLIGLLKEYFENLGHKVCVIYEPVEQWKTSGALARFYENVKERAYEFQTYAFVTRIKDIREKYDANRDADIFILERSIYSDRYVFTEMLRKYFDKTLNIMYDEWWNLFKELLPKMFWMENAKFIYLKPSINLCMERVQIRARMEEKTAVSSAYQTDLRAAYENFMCGKDYILLDKDYDCLNSEKDRKEVLDKIYEQIDGKSLSKHGSEEGMIIIEPQRA